MIASERRVLAEGETRLSLTKKLALSGRPVKIYVIDPKKFQERLEKFVGTEEFKQTEKKCQELQTLRGGGTVVKKGLKAKKAPVPIAIAPKEQILAAAPPPETRTTTMTTMILAPNTLLPYSMIPIVGSFTNMHNNVALPAPNQQPQETVAPEKKTVKKKKAVKRKLAEASKRKSEEKAEVAEMAFLMKESTTRTGRVSKSTTANNNNVSSNPPTPSSLSIASGSPNPSLVSTQSPKVRKREPPEKFRCQTCTKFYLGNAKFNQHFTKFPDHVKPDPNIGGRKPKKKKKKNPEQQPTIVQTMETQTEDANNGFNSGTEGSTNNNPPSPISSFNPMAPSDDDSIGIGAFTRIMRSKGACAINADTLSDNCSSPKLPAFPVEQDNSLFTPSNLTSRIDQPDYFLDFNNSISCSQQSFNSLENLLGDNNNSLASSTENKDIPPRPNTSTFFSSARSSCSSENVNVHDSRINMSSYVSVCSNSIPISQATIIEEECSNGAEHLDTFENRSHTQDSVASPKRRSIWEFVKEQIRLCGINQTCGEISEMAEKLSRIARDKFYPIQEEEVERLGTAPPVIQVDTPFVSHLLDLPFGTYIFKEDGGIRKIIPPPTPVSSTELSLTNEVDVDKFLSPDIDLISLPHLTNLDFNSM